jgi:protease-4
MIFALILLVLLGVSVLMNVGQLFESMFRFQPTHTRSAGPQLHEVVLEHNRAGSKIAVVPIEGIITDMQDRAGFSMVEIIKAQLKKAREDDDVKAVLLKVDSPGGEVLASDEISRALAEFQKKSDKPVVVSMGSLAASGGYYVSAPCRWIVANELTITGSIGVIMSSWNYRGLMSKVGIRPFTYKSGKYKDMLSGSRDPEEIPAEEREMLQALIDQTYARFKEVVTDGRKYAHEKNEDKGKTLASNWTDYADGRVLSGKEAHQLGFVDELGNFETAVDRAKDLADIKRANLIEYRLRVDIADILGLFGQSESRVVKVDVGIEAPKLEAGRLYFLWPTYLQ